MLIQKSTVPYIIQTNDTFYRISRYYNITLDDLIEANPGIDPDNIAAGQIVYIPITPPHFSPSSVSEVYTIKEGDTMYKLSQRFKVKLTTLIKSNPHINPDTPLAGQSICIPKPWSVYQSKTYKIEFKYPVRWARINDYFYEGLDGFFKISAISSEDSLERLCEIEAYHKLKPYGTHPSILKIEAACRNAYLIVPSADQPNEMNGQSALILKYDTPITIGSVAYNNLILWADSLHIRDILESILILE